MTSLRTANLNRKRAQRRVVYQMAYDYHMARCARLDAAGRLDKLKNSGFVQRLRKRGASWDQRKW